MLLSGGMRMIALVVVCACATTPPAARPTTVDPRAEPPKRRPTPLDGLGTNLLEAFFSRDNLVYYAGAGVATSAMVLSGGDHEAHLWLDRGADGGLWGDISDKAGVGLPLVAPLIYVSGLVTGDRDVTGAGSAAFQAVVITVATVGLLKVATGRPYPFHDEAIDDPERAREFSAFARVGAWPSGHTASTISLAASLTAYYPEKWWIPLVGYPLSLAIGYGMMTRDDHWASDVIAGALIGQAIGFTIGRNFRKRVRGESASDLNIAPMTGGAGVTLSGRW